MANMPVVEGNMFFYSGPLPGCCCIMDIVRLADILAGLFLQVRQECIRLAESWEGKEEKVENYETER